MSDNVPSIYIPQKSNVVLKNPKLGVILIEKYHETRSNARQHTEDFRTIQTNEMPTNNEIPTNDELVNIQKPNKQLVFTKSYVKSSSEERINFGKRMVKNMIRAGNKPSSSTTVSNFGTKKLNGEKNILYNQLCNIISEAKELNDTIKFNINYNFEDDDTSDDDANLNNDANSAVLDFNTAGKRIILINYEDDATRPIIEMEYKKMKIVERWHEMCDIFIEFEMTEQLIPIEVGHEKLQNILYYDLNYSMKDEFVNSYLPLIFNQITSLDKINKFEKKFEKKNCDAPCIINKECNEEIPRENKLYVTQKEVKNNKNLKYNEILKKYGIKIPDNIIPNNIIPSNVSCLNPFEKITNSSKIVKPYTHAQYVTCNLNDNDNNDKNKDKFTTKKYIFETQENVSEISNIECYNFEYNVLSPSFSNNAYQLDNCATYDLSELSKIQSSGEKQINLKNVDIYVIMYNIKYNKSFIIKNPSEDEIDLIENCDKYGFVNITNIQTNNNEILELTNNTFGLSEFNSVNELNLKLNAFAENIEYIYKHVKLNDSFMTEENKVKTFIHNNFTIDNNIENRMKSSLLYDKIIDSKIINRENIPSFKIRLAKYLQNMNLEKKRYSDGIYYYGIKSALN